MRAPKRHPLVEADLRSAYDWYEDQRAGLGLEFREAFRIAHLKLSRNPLLYAVRFLDIRRLNLVRFPVGIFYMVAGNDIYILAVLHAGRDAQNVLGKRRRGFFSNPV